MSAPVPKLVFLLDTPNIRRGRALAGTPARVLALAEHSSRSGADVTMMLCDRGADYGTEVDWPFDVALVHPTDFYNPTALAGVAARRGADFLVLCEAEALVAMGRRLAGMLDARLVYDMHDDDAEVAETVGESPTTVERHAKTQGAALENADAVIVSTRNEASLAAAGGVPASRTALLPNGADPRRAFYWGPDADASTLVFVGNLYYRPNAAAVEAICDTILPSVRAEGVDVRARIIGRGPASLTRSDRDIEFTGRVDTVSEAFEATTLALAPLTAGSGAKMKVLDYLAAGLPVLGTDQAVTGLPNCHPGVLVEDDLHLWPMRIAALLRDPALLELMGQAGRRCVEGELCWPQIGAELVRHCRSWLASVPSQAREVVDETDAGAPRWLAEHSQQDALGEPESSRPSQPRWLCPRTPQSQEGTDGFTTA
ncbi:glycosyltransferase family 4 protein [Streptomonospora salina]|uniref:Glycosyltransferase involved in cell wall biosynthesis n=1 Tax=Streptomonospora salina TaxID=104205 RepID=A0A841EBL4_9ACTN|nr:glycosyltransferase family 4 protein [Streptomonospora salina]MBB5998453.1 glycosyltransferase involved in cell wall biosynthesis [Streptomonospora salina]